MSINNQDLKLSIVDIGTKLKGNNASQTLKDSNRTYSTC